MQKENLIKFCKNILIKLNMDSGKAHATSEILVEADMMGHSTHGVRLLPNLSLIHISEPTRPY